MKKIVSMSLLTCLLLTACSKEPYMEPTEMLTNMAPREDIESSSSDVVLDEPLDDGFMVDVEDNAALEAYAESLTDLSVFERSEDYFDGSRAMTLAYKDTDVTLDTEASVDSIISTFEFEKDDAENGAVTEIYTNANSELTITNKGSYKECTLTPSTMDPYAQTFSVKYTADAIQEVKFSGYCRSDNQFTDDIYVNGLNLNSTLNDFVDKYGVPTSAEVKVTAIGDITVECAWHNPIKHSDYVLYVTAVVYGADEESFGYWISNYMFVRK